MQKSPGVIKLLSDLVAVDSQSYKSNKKIIALLKEWFKDYDHEIQDWVTEENDVKGQNLIVKVPGKSSERSLVFVCHTDTVPVGDLWETDPFILEEQEGKLYGRGTADTKGGVAAIIDAVFTLLEKPAYDTYLVFDGDEEGMWTGLYKFRKTHKLKNPIYICIEPTDQNVCIAAKSVLYFEVQTFGSGKHASYASPEINQKDSAIYKMHQVMDVLINDATRLAQDTDDVMGSNTQNLGVLKGGTAGNVIPEFCMVTVDRRLLSTIDPKKELIRVKELITKVDPKAKIVNVFCDEGFSTSNEKDCVTNILQCMRKKYTQAHVRAFQALSEGTILRNLGDVIVLGPGSIEQAHVANEFVESQDLFNFVHIFQDIMMTV